MMMTFFDDTIFFRIKVFLIIFLMVLGSTSSFFGEVAGKVEISKAQGLWQTYYESLSESAYRFNVGKELSGAELRLYTYSSGDINSDWIRVVFVGKKTAFVYPEGTFEVEPIVGFARAGYDNDGKITVGAGEHRLYYVLPQKNYVEYVNVTLYSLNGRPKLDVSRSRVLEWEPYEWYVQVVPWSLGWATYNFTGDGVGRFSLLSTGLGVPPGCPDESGINYYFGKSFKPPNVVGKPEVYVETSYVGGFNAAPESFAGKGNYRCKVNVGVGPGFTLNEAVYSGLNQTLYLREKYTPVGCQRLVAEDSAKGAIDIALAIGEEVIRSQAAKAVLSRLGLVLNIIEWADVISSLGFDEIVSNTSIIVYDSVKVDPDKQFFVWFNVLCQIKSKGLTGTIANFYGESPWGRPMLEGLFGQRVFELPFGGVQVGGILLHYHLPVLESAEPLGEDLPVNTKIVLRFSKPIDRGSIVKGRDTIVATANSKPIDFFDFFHFRDSGKDLTELVMSPNYHLDYGTRYVINFTSKIVDVFGFGLEPFTITFSTKAISNVPKNVYYNVSIMSGLYEFGSSLRGEVFRARIFNESINLGGPVGFAMIRTNDPLYDYWNEGACNVFKVGEKVYCKLSVAKDGGVPPRSGTIFELIDKISIKTTVTAEAEVLEVNPKGVSGSNLERIIEQTGVRPGERFTLEPVYVKEYSALGNYFGKIKFYSDEIAKLNGKELSVYLILHAAPWDLIPDKPPAYQVSLGSASPAPVDFVVYTISDEYVGAWRLIPLSSENRQYTYNFMVNFQGQDREVYVFSNSTVSNFYYNQTIQTISFKVSGKSGTRGYLRIGIPIEMVKARPMVFFDEAQVPFSVNESEQRYWIYFEYPHSTHTVKIIFSTSVSPEPQQPQPYISYALAALLASSIIALIAFKRRRSSLLKKS
jgi:hypothetical protein